MLDAIARWAYPVFMAAALVALYINTDRRK